MKPKPFCDLCGNQHHFTDDGFQYLDCYWYFRSRDTKLGKRKEPQVEIWDKEKKEWVEKNSYLNQLLMGMRIFGLR